MNSRPMEEHGHNTDYYLHRRPKSTCNEDVISSHDQRSARGFSVLGEQNFCSVARTAYLRQSFY